MTIRLLVFLTGAIVTTTAAGKTGVLVSSDQRRPLSTQGLENLQALARLLGYVRYFHPSGAAAAADWEQIAIQSVQAVEHAPSPRELSSSLMTALGPVSAGVAVFPTGTPAPRPGLKPGPYLIEWRHHGVGLSQNDRYYSERVTRPASGNGSEIDLIRAELPGGVSCVVPRVLYMDTPGVFRLTGFAGTRSYATADDRSVRLAAVIIAWNVPQHFCPYFDVAHPHLTPGAE
jgi:hypothetical protein